MSFNGATNRKSDLTVHWMKREAECTWLIRKDGKEHSCGLFRGVYKSWSSSGIPEKEPKGILEYSKFRLRLEPINPEMAVRRVNIFIYCMMSEFKGRSQCSIRHNYGII
jgi:hypothetical protein